MDNRKKPVSKPIDSEMFITAVDARKLSDSIDIEEKLAPQVESHVNRVCHAIKYAASNGDTKVSCDVPNELVSRVTKRIRGLGFRVGRGWLGLFRFGTKTTVRIVVRW